MVALGWTLRCEHKCGRQRSCWKKGVSSYSSWQWQTWPSSERWFLFVEKQQSSSSPSCCPCPPRERSKGLHLSSWTPAHPAQCAEDLTAETRRHFTLNKLWPGHHLLETNWLRTDSVCPGLVRPVAPTRGNRSNTWRKRGVSLATAAAPFEI